MGQILHFPHLLVILADRANHSEDIGYEEGLLFPVGFGLDYFSLKFGLFIGVRLCLLSGTLMVN